MVINDDLCLKCEGSSIIKLNDTGREVTLKCEECEHEWVEPYPGEGV